MTAPALQEKDTSMSPENTSRPLTEATVALEKTSSSKILQIAIEIMNNAQRKNFPSRGRDGSDNKVRNIDDSSYLGPSALSPSPVQPRLLAGRVAAAGSRAGGSVGQSRRGQPHSPGCHLSGTGDSGGEEVRREEEEKRKRGGEGRRGGEEGERRRGGGGEEEEEGGEEERRYDCQHYSHTWPHQLYSALSELTY